MITRFAWSVRTRLTLAAGVVMALVCAAGSVLAMLGLHDQAVNVRTNHIVAEALKVVHLTKRGVLPALLKIDDIRAIQVIDAHGTVISATPGLLDKPPMASFRPDELSARQDKIVCNSPDFPDQCMIMVTFRIYQPDGDWAIYAADPVVPWFVGPQILAALIAGSLFLTAITTLGTYRTVGNTLAPVARIRQKLAEITATDLGQRVSLPRYRDEIRALAITVNETLDRLEKAVERQRRFASDASHDLRSPITAMRTQVEEALMFPEDTDWQATANALLTSLDRLQAIVSDLLLLARLDAGTPGETDMIDLTDFVAKELDRRPRKKKLDCDLQPGVPVRGDKLRLSRLLANLVDNAERHAIDHVRIAVYPDGETAVLEVQDDGAGIDPGEREVVFQRFTRLDAARSRDAGGTGLGLPIAREIAEAHGGILTVEDSDRGALFVLRLPLHPEE
ncbi:sensor histidine kinase [Sinosporangium siamense]|uniref:histidine kinase n=1 Tax=Sinosporangium siamense TaxID=1367973 RepID=A0A919RFM5_9ACTN|nr:HAMP domain-containing sensor histidine kinase [Sinosporangium siamense]GII91910.1 two-component sensor histidine kinase [Sinosporangium siamense]